MNSQFLNVLKGDMAWDRGPSVLFCKEISEIMPFYETRHVIKPGLTVGHKSIIRYGASIDDSLIKLQYDLYYIKHRAFIWFEYCTKTITVLFYRGQ
jgi:lipopolysaccharide/colanic/teichoic acid biosynthesis glycosyltransferase